MYSRSSLFLLGALVTAGALAIGCGPGDTTGSGGTGGSEDIN